MFLTKVERLTYNTAKMKVPVYFSSAFIFLQIFMYLTGDITTLFGVIDNALCQGQVTNWIVTIVFSAAMTIDPALVGHLAKCKPCLDKKSDKHLSDKTVIIILLSAFALALGLSTTMRLAFMPDPEAEQAATEIVLSGIDQSSKMATVSAEESTSGMKIATVIFTSLLPLVFGVASFATTYIAGSGEVAEAKAFNHKLKQKILNKRLHRFRDELGDSEEMAADRIERCKQVIAAIFSMIETQHIERVSNSQAEMACHNSAQPGEVHTYMLEGYLNKDSLDFDMDYDNSASVNESSDKA